MLVLLGWLVLPWAVVTAQPPAPLSPGTAPPFQPGERLVYRLSWLAIPAGTATLEVFDAEAAPRDEARRGEAYRGEAYRMVATARSNAFVSAFYPVANHVESLVDQATLAPRRLIFQRREGRGRNDYDVTFRQADGEVTSIKDGVAKSLSIPPGTQDVLSCLYYFRGVAELVPGASLTLTVHHDQKNYPVEVRVENLEKLDGPWGEVETVRVLVIMPFRGLFLNEGNIQVWFTNDPNRVPLKMKAKVVIGSVVAELIDGFHSTRRA